MTKQGQVNIIERAKTYDIKYEYHSDLLCENRDAEIEAIEETGGKITFKPRKGDWFSFMFDHSDPDLVIAIANMMGAFAKMVKKNNTNNIDTPKKA